MSLLIWYQFTFILWTFDEFPLFDCDQIVTTPWLLFVVLWRLKQRVPCF